MSPKPVGPYSNTRQDSPFLFLGVQSVLRSTGENTSGAYALMEQISIPPGFASPYHTHHREDESFYILEGEVAFVCAGKWLKAGPGGYVFGPREIPHGFKVVSASPASMLILCAPSGFERFVLELAEPIGSAPSEPEILKLVAVAAKYGIDIHGPLPEMS